VTLLVAVAGLLGDQHTPDIQTKRIGLQEAVLTQHFVVGFRYYLRCHFCVS
jgi:hypothetical protein